MFSADYGGMAKIKVNSTLLWKPDIVLHNSVTGNFKTTEQGHHYKSKSSGFPRQGSPDTIHGTELSNDLWERNSWMATSCALSDKLWYRYKGTDHFWQSKVFEISQPKIFFKKWHRQKVFSIRFTKLHTEIWFVELFSRRTSFVTYCR